ncbi:hypothetical protein [Candidatus Protochlamydia phocaeensis]|uniref:hypothetical protein n=1 Tax=Candidatus Protochlamydia phocaeensis TaxID=1414722 RepID=UPI000838DE31|nr:hypothetical protein [Candidatus Protochlamydia phocaeensis]
MSSSKQLLANQKNALLSTGPMTAKGKEVISANAIKHGIFTKDLFAAALIGQEDQDAYREMLGNLQQCLLPQDQMESLLVEKIAMDFWRLKRVIQFEAGSIQKSFETLLKDFYSYGRKNNNEIDQEIEEKKGCRAWIAAYLASLKKGLVSFDDPLWSGEEIESDMTEDFYLIAKTIGSLSSKEKEKLANESYHFMELKDILNKNGYSSAEAISQKLLDIYAKQDQRLENEIKDLERRQLDHANVNQLSTMLAMIPQPEIADKILKYDRSLQKSIFQNLLMLKKLQGVF